MSPGSASSPPSLDSANQLQPYLPIPLSRLVLPCRHPASPLRGLGACGSLLCSTTSLSLHHLSWIGATSEMLNLTGPSRIGMTSDHPLALLRSLISRDGHHQAWKLVGRTWILTVAHHTSVTCISNHLSPPCHGSLRRPSVDLARRTIPVSYHLDRPAYHRLGPTHTIRINIHHFNSSNPSLIARWTTTGSVRTHTALRPPQSLIGRMHRISSSIRDLVRVRVRPLPTRPRSISQESTILDTTRIIRRTGGRTGARHHRLLQRRCSTTRRSRHRPVGPGGSRIEVRALCYRR
jgi:hypothetical protein